MSAVVDFTPREYALQTLRTVVDNPSAMASHVELAAALDALATVYASNVTDDMPPRARALRGALPVWQTIYAHVENRLMLLSSKRR